MGNCPFCNLEPAPKKPRGLLHRAWGGIQWIFPTALLVLMPKCPLCVAAYIALLTGVGVSVATAQWVQVLMVMLCLMSLAYLGFKFRRSAAVR
jgi:hypothetical protein